MTEGWNSDGVWCYRFFCHRRWEEERNMNFESIISQKCTTSSSFGMCARACPVHAITVRHTPRNTRAMNLCIDFLFLFFLQCEVVVICNCSRNKPSNAKLLQRYVPHNNLKEYFGWDHFSMFWNYKQSLINRFRHAIADILCCTLRVQCHKLDYTKKRI